MKSSIWMVTILALVGTMASHGIATSAEPSLSKIVFFVT